MHSLARGAGVNPSHLSKVLRQAHYKTPSARLAEKVARALDLPPEYFPEYREAVVLARVKRDAQYRDQLFEKLRPEEREIAPRHEA
jgi:transcriptional regulator with XRE-family HTH domain